MCHAYGKMDIYIYIYMLLCVYIYIHMMYKTHSVHIDMFFMQKEIELKKNKRMDSHGRFPFAKSP